MTITMVVDTFDDNNNGTTISVMRFARVLRERGHCVRVLTCEYSRHNRLDTPIDMFYVPEMRIPLVSWLARRQSTLFARPVKETLEAALDGADMVHIHQPFPLGWSAKEMADKKGIATLASYHIQPENFTYNLGLRRIPAAARLVYYLLDKIFYHRFAHVHCPSSFIAERLRAHGYRARLHVISNGADEAFCPAGQPLKAPGEPFNILMTGRLSPEKRQDVLIRAVARSKHARDIQVYLAGHGPCEGAYKKLGRILPRPPVIGYYGQEELIALMRNCDLYVHTSDVETESISCIEAISCGLVPVISDSKRSAARQFALSGKNLFRAGDCTSLARKIDLWIQRPRLLRKARAAHLRHAQKYTLQSVADTMERLYISLISEVQI